jgi:hypothetical protein
MMRGKRDMLPPTLTTPLARVGVAACAPLLAKAAFLVIPTAIVGYMMYSLCREVRWDEFAKQQDS